MFALSPDAKGLAQDMYQALWVVPDLRDGDRAVTLATKPRPEAELRGLVYSLTEVAHEEHTSWLHKPLVWGMAALGVLVVLQIIFW